MIRNVIDILLELLESETASRAAMLHMTLRWKTNKGIHTHRVHLYSLRLEISGIDISGSLQQFRSSKLNVHK